MRPSGIAALLLLSACSQPQLATSTPVAAPAAGALPSTAVVPIVDHHQHLLSEPARKVTLDWVKGWPLEAVALPAELQRLLAAREAAWNDRAALTLLLRERAVLLSVEGRWLTGRDTIADQLSRTFGRPYRMRPVAFSIDGSSGYIAGYYTRGEAAETTYVGYFHLDLVRTGGQWRILGETQQFPGPKIEPLVDADLIVKMLDEVGISKALVFSNAYYFARGPVEQAAEHGQVRAENDWTLAQVRRHPTRLYAACSVNPLRGYAVAEIERCHGLAGFIALKLHFDGSGVDLKEGDHLASVRNVFASANRLRLPIIVHLQSEAGYSADHARIFLTEVLPSAPDVTVTINHLWGGGRYGEESTKVLAKFAEAFRRQDPAVANLWFDLAQIALAAPNKADRAQMVGRMREIGLGRMLYGSDGPEWGGLPPDEHWEDFVMKMPLTRDELNTIAANVAPYLR